MVSRITKGSDLNIEHISFKEYKNKHGNTTINLKHDNKSIVLQTPKMSLPWNLSCYQTANKETYTMTQSFKGMENDQELEDFYNNLVELDKLILDAAKENKERWFNGQYTDESLEELYTPIIKHSLDKISGEPDGKYPPTIRIKIPFNMNKFRINIYDEDKNAIDLESIPLPSIIVKEKELKTIIEINNIWIINGRFGCTLNCVQIKMVNGKTNTLEFLNNNSDISDDEYDVSSDED